VSLRAQCITKLAERRPRCAEPMTARTALEWQYEPATFFEGPIDESLSHGRLTCAAGKATYALAVPADPLPSDVQSAIENEVEAHFKPWQVATGKALGIVNPDWRFIHDAANNMPLRQGVIAASRCPTCSDATREELDRARNVARNIIQSFAARV